MNNQNIRHALSKIAWAYLLILLNFRINDLDLLPNWAGYLLIFLAIGQLSGELRNLPLLKPFCVLLGAAELLDWLAVFLAGEPLTGQFFLVNALIVCVSLYFHFQLLTDLAALAEEMLDDGELAKRLRTSRTLFLLGQTALYCYDLVLQAMGLVVLLLAVTFCVSVLLLFQLWGFSRDLETQQSP